MSDVNSIGNMPNSIETGGSWTSFIFNVMMMFTPTLGYFAQISTFKELNSSKGFSKIISLILIVSSILRIFFWFGKSFHWSLLGQSIVMVFMQIYLLSECLKYGSKETSNKPVNFFDFKSFWEWPLLIDYVFFIICFVLALVLLSFIFTFQDIIFVEALGSFSAMVEASLGVPQVFSNLRNKSTQGLSTILVGNWLFGDLVKTFFFLQTAAPIQLIICGLTQILIDFIIIFHIYLYASETSNISSNSSKILNKSANEKMSESIQDYDDKEPLHTA